MESQSTNASPSLLLYAGKLLSQDQLSAFLKFILNSQLLRKETGTDVLPESVRGRKVLSELRNEVTKATLQFRMKKEFLIPMQSLWLIQVLDHDKIQDLLFKTIQIEGHR